MNDKHNNSNTKIMTMRTLLYMLFLFMAVYPANAQQYADEPRHNGIVQEAAGYHVEMVQRDGELRFYLLEAEDDPSLDYTAVYVALRFPNKPEQEVLLAKTKSGYYTASYPEITMFESCKLFMMANGKEITATFLNGDAKRIRKHGRGHGH